ncbi:MAG: two-component system, NtrC family, response regulator HydG [Blastocatellia bacterium]|jgi:DNA-binding NtrC family response regulator|nr:two-component system, NtrC family, response regulator HydG [Blastocatellia bacterium]
MTRKICVLVVDDDNLLRKLVTTQLGRSGFDASAAAGGQEALNHLQATDCDVVLLDIQMPGMSGLDALREIRKMEDAPEVVMLTADTSLATGIEAMRLGAYDYLTKPARLDEMEAVIRKADEKRRLIRQNAGLRAVVVQEPESADEESGPNLIYRSAAMAAVVSQAETAARVDSTLLITGESGTGKDVLVRYIHARSPRKETPIITINCGALPEALFESEFFGHERGAFTGANSLKRGLIEAADGSTLFLDEVGETPLPMQVKLLHFLEEGRFRRVGSTRDQSADVRIIAATNRHLPQDVQDKRFRADLFYRLNVVSLHVPPLRERPADIPALIEHFLGLYRQRFKRPALDVSAEARRQLEGYGWPGNVRELRNCLERAAALSTGDMIEAAQVLPGRAAGAATTGTPEAEMASAQASNANTGETPPATLDQLERQHILRVLDETGGNRERAAAILGISARTLYRKLREYERDEGATTRAGA